MQIISIAGTTGRDAEYKTTQSGAEMAMPTAKRQPLGMT